MNEAERKFEVIYLLKQRSDEIVRRAYIDTKQLIREGVDAHNLLQVIEDELERRRVGKKEG